MFHWLVLWVKPHLIINDKGELLDFILTPGNVDDREPLKSMDLHKRIFGKLFVDKGYISKDLLEQLFIDRVRLVNFITIFIIKVMNQSFFIVLFFSFILLTCGYTLNY